MLIIQAHRGSLSDCDYYDLVVDGCFLHSPHLFSRGRRSSGHRALVLQFPRQPNHLILAGRLEREMEQTGILCKFSFIFSWNHFFIFVSFVLYLRTVLGAWLKKKIKVLVILFWWTASNPPSYITCLSWSLLT